MSWFVTITAIRRCCVGMRISHLSRRPDSLGVTPATAGWSVLCANYQVRRTVTYPPGLQVAAAIATADKKGLMPVFTA